MEKALKQFLRLYKRARERKYKNDALAYFLVKIQGEYPELEGIPIKTLGRFVSDYNSADRYWRKIMENNENLRGEDYDTKEKVEQNYQLNIGYEPGYKNDTTKRTS